MTQTTMEQIEKLTRKYAEESAALNEAVGALEAELEAVKKARMKGIKALVTRTADAKAALHEVAQHQRKADHQHARRRHQAGRNGDQAGPLGHADRPGMADQPVGGAQQAGVVAALAAGFPQRAEQADDNTRPRGADRMTQGDRSTIDVDFLRVDLSQGLVAEEVFFREIR